MPLKIDQRVERLQARLRELAFWRARATREIDGWRCDGQPIVVGAPWPRRDGVLRFEALASVPDAWPLDETRLWLDLGGESLLTLRYDGGESAAFGLDVNHQEFPLAGRRVAIASESRSLIHDCSARFSSGSTSRSRGSPTVSPSSSRRRKRWARTTPSSRWSTRRRRRCARSTGPRPPPITSRASRRRRASRLCGADRRPSSIRPRSERPNAPRSSRRTRPCARGSPSSRAASRPGARWR